MDQAAYFEQMRQKRRIEILSAAKALMTEQGLNAFNMQQLARSLDISTVTLYKYYKNSEDIMQAVRQQILTDRGSVDKLIPEKGSALEKFLESINNFFSEVMKYKQDFTLLCLIEIFTRNQTSVEDSFYHSYNIKEFSEQLFSLLETAGQEGSVGVNVDYGEAMQFIRTMNHAMTQHIALLGDDTYKSSKNELIKQIEMLIETYRKHLAPINE